MATAEGDTNVIPMSNAAKQKRYRDRKRQAKAGTPATPVTRRQRNPVTRRPSAAAIGVATTTGALLLVSLTHVSAGVTMLTDCGVIEGWLMACGVDALLVATLYAVLSATDEIRKAIHWPALALEALTLGASGYLNALADSHGIWDLAHLPAIAFGLFVPLAVSLGSAILARLK